MPGEEAVAQRGYAKVKASSHCHRRSGQENPANKNWSLLRARSAPGAVGLPTWTLVEPAFCKCGEPANGGGWGPVGSSGLEAGKPWDKLAAGGRAGGLPSGLGGPALGHLHAASPLCPFSARAGIRRGRGPLGSSPPPPPGTRQAPSAKHNLLRKCREPPGPRGGVGGRDEARVSPGPGIRGWGRLQVSPAVFVTWVVTLRSSEGWDVSIGSAPPATPAPRAESGV